MPSHRKSASAKSARNHRANEAGKPGLGSPSSSEPAISENCPSSCGPQHLLIVGLVALLVRGLYFCELYGTLPFSTLIIDGRAYDQWAQRISGGQWWGTEVFYQAPLYPYLMAVAYGLFGPSAMLIRIFQVLLSVASCLLIAHCGQRLFGNRAGLIAGLMLAIYPPAIFFDGLIQKASLDLFLVTLLLALIVKAQLRRSWRWLVAIGVVLAALMLNRENARVAYPLLVGWILLFFSEHSFTRRVAWASLFTAAMALVLLPVGLRNYVVGGEFQLTTSQFGPNFYIGNHAGANGTYLPLFPGRGDPKYERADATRLAQQAEGRTLSPGEVSDYWLSQSLQYIRSQPASWIKLMGWKALLTLHGIEVIDSESIYLYANYSVLLRWLYRVWHFGIVLPLAVFGCWVTRHRWRELAVFYGLFLLLAATTALFFVFARYRFTLAPISIVFAAGAVSSMAGMIRQKGLLQTFSRYWPGLLAGIGMAVICNYPLTNQEDIAANYSNLGAGLLDDQRAELALQAFELALKGNPKYAHAAYNQGIALQKLGRNSQAIDSFLYAVQLDPQLGDAHSRLAQHYVDIGQPQKAVVHFQSATAQVAEPGLLHFEWGQLLLLQGDSAGALQQFRNAYQLDSKIILAGNNLAWLLATSPDEKLRNGAEAVRVAEAVVGARSLVEDQSADVALDIGFLDTLACAYAEAGRFVEAIATAKQGIEKAEKQGDGVSAEELKSKLQLFEANKPFRTGLTN